MCDILKKFKNITKGGKRTMLENMPKDVNARISDYLVFANGDFRQWIDLRNFKSGDVATLWGKGTRIGVIPGEYILTTHVVKVEGRKAYTKNESIYKLDTLDRDYKMYLEAKENSKVHILYDWFIEWEDEQPKITAKDEGEEVSGIIIGQINNRNVIILDNGKNYFVHWITLSTKMACTLISKKETMWRTIAFERYGMEKCKPILFA